MKKNSLALILLLCCGYSFAQSKDKTVASETIAPSITEPKIVSENVTATTDKAATNNQVFEKNQFPQNQKAAPAIFYVENDKPCERQTYMSHLKQTAPKN